MKQFREDLNRTSTALVGSFYGNEDDETFINLYIDKLKEYVKENREKLNYRTVAKNQTNAVKFSNGSWLYFDQDEERRFYEDGNFRFFIMEQKDDRTDYKKQVLCYVL